MKDRGRESVFCLEHGQPYSPGSLWIAAMVVLRWFIHKCGCGHPRFELRLRRAASSEASRLKSTEFQALNVQRWLIFTDAHELPNAFPQPGSAGSRELARRF